MKVGAERQEALRQALERSGAEPREAKGSGELWRYAIDGVTVTLWRTGTVQVQGSGEMLEVARRLVEDHAVPGTPSPIRAAAGGPPAGAAGDLPRDRPWVGVDESGKGDYFGPLVSAAVVVDPDHVDELVAAGVRDSKRLTDRRVRALAPGVRSLTRHALTRVAPPRYNALYDDFRREGKRLNQLLAWAHIRSLRTLLQAGEQPAYAIVDQFADAAVIDRAARGWTTDLRIVQFPRAEADVAVAAASVLAREAFLDWLRDASGRTGVDLPRGASPQVVEAARRIAARGGRDALGQVAKLHFATTAKVLD